MKLVKIEEVNTQQFIGTNGNVFRCARHIEKNITDPTQDKTYDILLAPDNCFGGVTIASHGDNTAEEWSSFFVNLAIQALRESRSEELGKYDLVRINILDETPGYAETQYEKQARVQWFTSYKDAPQSISINNAQNWQTVIPVKPARLQEMFNKISAPAPNAQ